MNIPDRPEANKRNYQTNTGGLRDLGGQISSDGDYYPSRVANIVSHITGLTHNSFITETKMLNLYTSKRILKQNL